MKSGTVIYAWLSLPHAKPPFFEYYHPALTTHLNLCVYFCADFALLPIANETVKGKQH